MGEPKIEKNEFNFLVDLFNRTSNYDVVGVSYEEHRAIGIAIDNLRPFIVGASHEADGQG